MHRLGVPIHPLYLPRLLLRATLLWLGARLLIMGTAARLGERSLVLTGYALLLLVLIVVVCAHVDARVMRETTFQANFGTSPRAAGTVAALLTLALEATITAAVHALS